MKKFVQRIPKLCKAVVKERRRHIDQNILYINCPLSRIFEKDYLLLITPHLEFKKNATALKHSDGSV